MEKAAFRVFAASVILTPIAMLVAFSEPHFILAKALFPFAFLAGVLAQRDRFGLTDVFILAAVQFPAYGWWLGRGLARHRGQIYAATIAIVHMIAVVAAFTGMQRF